MERTIASAIRPKVHRRTRRRAGGDKVRTAPTRHGPVAATATSAVAPWKPIGGQRNTTCTARAPVSAPRIALGRRGNTPAKASNSAASAGSTSQPRLMTTASTPSHNSVPRGARRRSPCHGGGERGGIDRIDHRCPRGVAAGQRATDGSRHDQQINWRQRR